MRENVISKIVLDACIKIHSALGPGLLEDVYEKVLCYELMERGLRVESQVPLPVYWKEVKIELAYRIDMIVEDKVLIELKSVESLSSVHFKQIQTYLDSPAKNWGCSSTSTNPS